MEQKKVKIFAIPFAGGSKYSYRALENKLPSHFDWETIELPGRGTRMQEELLTDIEATTAYIFREIQHRVQRVEYMIYGHSMGTLLGYELAKKIVESGLKPPICLFLTGHEAPSLLKCKKISSYEKNAFWQEVKKLGGLPNEVMENEELRDFFEPVLRADFKTVEGYKYQAPQQPLPVPVFVRVGSEEDIVEEELMEWQNETRYKLDVQVLPGDHFFIFKNPDHLIRHIDKAYTVATSMHKYHVAC